LITARSAASREQPRPRVSVLRQGGQRPHLDEAEAEAEHLPEHLGILVEPGREPDRVGEIESRDPHRQDRVGLGGPSRRQQLQRADRRPMRPLRVEREGEGPQEG